MTTAYHHGSCVMLFMLLVASLCGIVTALGDQEGRRHISREEHFQVKNKLRFLNRPSVKSIQTENGDIFDCVDIHKQPAFDHPSLKNHTIQLRPSFVPNQVKSTSDESSANSFTTLNTGLLDGGCPDGTVPIRRVHGQDILRANSISDFGKKLFVRGDHHYAIKRGEGKFYGVKGNMNIWKPAVRNDQQFSLSQFWIVNTNGILNTIEAGWHVDPAIYNGDRTPRLFVYWTADNYQSTGCYNLMCSGFVQVSKFTPVGLALNQTSVYMKDQYELELTVFRDPESGNWWLTYGSEHDFVGYLPSSLFTNLNEGGSAVSWGGEVFVTKFDFPEHYPEMGSGSYPSEGYKKSCYTRKLQVSGDDPNSIVFKDIENANTVIMDTPKCYNMTDAQDPDFKPGFFFGGHGAC